MPVDGDGIDANKACHVIDSLWTDTVNRLDSVTELVGGQLRPEVLGVLDSPTLKKKHECLEALHFLVMTPVQEGFGVSCVNERDQ